MVALTDKPEKTAEAIRSRGGTPYIVRTGVEGVRVEKEDPKDPIMEIPEMY